MIWIDNELHTSRKAINALNYDKLGHETGLGSWGVILDIQDSFEEDMTLFLGLKFDVLTIATNRFVMKFINIDKENKEKIDKLRKSDILKPEIDAVSSYDENTRNEDNIIEFYLDIHKVEIDIVEFAKRVYSYKSEIEEYSELAQSDIFKTFRKKRARNLSANMQRQYEGNLENFGYIFEKGNKLFLINELIIPRNIINDEIYYTSWITPHDLEEHNFLEKGEAKFEKGDEYTESLGGVITIDSNPEPQYTYDRRGFRNGYLDVSVENPLINHGYTDENVEYNDTGFWMEETTSAKHKKKSIVKIDSTFRMSSHTRLFAIADWNVSSKNIPSVLKSFLDSKIKIDLMSKIFPLKTGSTLDAINELCDSEFIDSAIDAFDTELIVPDANVFIGTVKEHLKSTLVTPLVISNLLRDWDNINAAQIKDSVILMYHPILDKTIFFEADEFDSSVIKDGEVMFEVDGLKFGYKINDREGIFVWSNIEKPFRNVSSNWMNLLGNVIEKGELPDPMPQDTVSRMAAVTDSGMFVCDDLSFEGNYATIMAINKVDFAAFIKKTFGKVVGPYSLGLKAGEANLDRSTLWM